MDTENKNIEEKNILMNELKQLDQQIKDPSKKAFSKTTFWNQLPLETGEQQDTLLKEIKERMQILQDKLEQLENLLLKLISEKNSFFPPEP